MSLINEALKKAQRSRSGDPADSAGMAVGEMLVAKRRPPTSARMMLLYAAGGLVAFVLCVVGTVYFLNRPAAQPATPAPAIKPVANAPAPVTAPVVSLPTPSPAATPPAPKPAAATTPEPAPVAVVDKPAPAPAVTPAPRPVTPPVAVIPDPVPAAPALRPAPAANADERVQLYLETVRITAVRALGGPDSRVMMNDRVYRVNDIVDRNLSLRLTKVEASQLTFTDANGVPYIKYF